MIPLIMIQGESKVRSSPNTFVSKLTSFFSNQWVYEIIDRIYNNIIFSRLNMAFKTASFSEISLNYLLLIIIL
jgi:hypothetical protein